MKKLDDLVKLAMLAMFTDMQGFPPIDTELEELDKEFERVINESGLRDSEEYKVLSSQAAAQAESETLFPVPTGGRNADDMGHPPGRVDREGGFNAARMYYPEEFQSAVPPPPQAEKAVEPETKLVYVKRWRTIVRLPVKYADEIVEALRSPPAQAGQADLRQDGKPENVLRVWNEARALTPREQWYLAEMVANNVGYELVAQAEHPDSPHQSQPVNVTPEMVEAVKAAKCFACGAYTFEDCKRHPNADCGREFHGGSRVAITGEKND